MPSRLSLWLAGLPFPRGRLFWVLTAVVVGALALWLAYFFTNPAFRDAPVICMDGWSAGAPSDQQQCVVRNP